MHFEEPANLDKDPEYLRHTSQKFKRADKAMRHVRAKMSAVPDRYRYFEAPKRPAEVEEAAKNMKLSAKKAHRKMQSMKLDHGARLEHIMDLSKWEQDTKYEVKNMMSNFEKSTEFNLDFMDKQHNLAKTEVVREIVKMCNFDNFAKSRKYQRQTGSSVRQSLTQNDQSAKAAKDDVKRSIMSPANLTSVKQHTTSMMKTED